MRIKFFILITFLQLSMSLCGLIFAQNKVIRTKDSVNITKLPKAIMRPKNMDSIAVKVNQGDAKKEKLEKVEDQKLDEVLIQDIFNFSKSDFITYEKLNFDEEHISLFLNDTISIDIKKNKQLLQKSNESICNLLNGFGESYADSSKRNKLRPQIIEELRTLYDEEYQSKDLSKKLSNQKQAKEKEAADAKEQLEKLQLRLKPKIDSINKIIARVKETTVLKIEYNSVVYRVLVVPSTLSNIKLHTSNKNELQSLKEVWDTFKEKPFALLNAGMYESDGSSKGLLMMNRKLVKNLDESSKSSFGNFYLQPNGVFYLDTLGRVYVVKTDEFKQMILAKKIKSITYATQSGPMLLIGGKSNPNFYITSINKNIRNGVGVVDNLDNKVAVFIISDNPCTFYDMASLFRIFRCSNALYLDGAISKMYTEIKGKKTGNVSEGLLGPILSVSKKK